MIINVLIADKNPSTTEIIKRYLELLGPAFNIFITDTGQKAMDIIEKQEIELVISGNGMPGISGLDVVQRIKK